MRFRLGPIPQDPSFDPAHNGWRPIIEPGPLAIQLMALPVAIVAALSSARLISLTTSGPGEPLMRLLAPPNLPLWVWLVVLVVGLPIHEAIHAVLHPDWGLSAQTVIGLWPRQAVFYANFEAAMTRNRQLLVLAGPYVVLSLLPIGLQALTFAGGGDSTLTGLLRMLSLVGAVLAAGDLVSFALLQLQVPTNAVVRNQGWKTYWRLAASQCGRVEP